jgi:hypothetical protein
MLESYKVDKTQMTMRMIKVLSQFILFVMWRGNFPKQQK